MKLNQFEMETIICFNRAEKTAEVYTADSVMMRKMDRLCDESDEAKLVGYDEGYSKTYQVPKSWIKVHKRRSSPMTDEQKQAAAERLRKARDAKKADEMKD